MKEDKITNEDVIFSASHSDKDKSLTTVGSYQELIEEFESRGVLP